MKNRALTVYDEQVKNANQGQDIDILNAGLLEFSLRRSGEEVQLRRIRRRTTKKKVLRKRLFYGCEAQVEHECEEQVTSRMNTKNRLIRRKLPISTADLSLFGREREIVEIVHHNSQSTMIDDDEEEDDKDEDDDNRLMIEEKSTEQDPMLVKETVETVELCTGSPSPSQNPPESRFLLTNNDSMHVTMVRDVRTAMFDCYDDGSGRLDLETLYIVEAGREKKEDKCIKTYYEVYERDMFTKTMIIYQPPNQGSSQSKRSVLDQRYERGRERVHLEVALGEGIHSFELPTNEQFEEEQEVEEICVSVKYRHFSSERFCAYERRLLSSFAKPIKMMIEDSLKKTQANNLTIPIVVVSNDEQRRNLQNTTTSWQSETLALLNRYSSATNFKHPIREQDFRQMSVKVWQHGGEYVKRQEKNRENTTKSPQIYCSQVQFFLQPTLPKNDSLKLEQKRPLAPAIISNNGLNTSVRINNDNDNNELSFHNSQFLREKRIELSESVKRAVDIVVQTSQKKKESKIERSVEEPDTELSLLNRTQEIEIRTCNQPKSIQIPILSMSKVSSSSRRQSRADNAKSKISTRIPVVVLQKKEMINEQLDELRKSIRRHPQDSYRAHFDQLKRSSSWTHLHKQSRHIRAKLIPVWQSKSSREYFARVEDYVSDRIARTIRRSYSMSYLQKGGQNRIQWIRIPGEVIKIEEERSLEMRGNSQRRQSGNVAEIRELPYDMKYWNILHLLSAERVVGKQITPNIWTSAENWIFRDESFASNLTAQDILSPTYPIQSQTDSTLKWFLTYDQYTELTNQRYQKRLQSHGIPMMVSRPATRNVSELPTYRRTEKLVRYEKLPDRMVPVHTNVQRSSAQMGGECEEYCDNHQPQINIYKRKINDHSIVQQRSGRFASPNTTTLINQSQTARKRVQSASGIFSRQNAPTQPPIHNHSPDNFYY